MQRNSPFHLFLKPVTLAIAMIAILAVADSPFRAAPAPAADSLPHEVTDMEFWRMVSEFSEPGGSFRFQFMSNEREYPTIIPNLKKAASPGGVYLGVGPEQNFSYIAALQPKIAFIFDIRPENMLEHLIYKSVFEMSATRADFVSRLFSRARPANLAVKPSVNALFQAYRAAQPNSRLFDQNLQAIQDHLVKDHHFPLTRTALADIATIYRDIVDAGPGNGGRGASYADLMTATDAQGQTRSYLSSDENYLLVREMQQKNLIIPLVGDFAGPKAIRAVAGYLKDHQAAVTAFYTSNVEQYLFQQDDDWRHFYQNVATLPVNAASTFVRSSHFTYMANGQRLDQFNGTNYVMLLCPIADLVRAFNAGRIQDYDDMIRLAKP
jgi:hypothetical protein